MFGVFGLSLAATVVMCLLAITLGLSLAMFGAALFYEGGGIINDTLIVLVGFMIGAVGCVFIIAQPDGYVGEAKYVEDSIYYERGVARVSPTVEVEDKGRFPVKGSEIVMYEIGDMIPVECYDNFCKVGGGG